MSQRRNKKKTRQAKLRINNCYDACQPWRWSTKRWIKKWQQLKRRRDQKEETNATVVEIRSVEMIGRQCVEEKSFDILKKICSLLCKLMVTTQRFSGWKLRVEFLVKLFYEPLMADLSHVSNSSATHIQKTTMHFFEKEPSQSCV